MDTDNLEEKWGKPTKVSPEEQGKYAGKTKAELLGSYQALKKSGPHKKGSPEYGRMRELAFAIRAKTGWGKVENAEHTGDSLEEKRKAPRNPWAVGMKTAMHLKKDEPPLKKSTIAKAHDISRAIMRKESIGAQDVSDQDYNLLLDRLRKLAGM